MATARQLMTYFLNKATEADVQKVMREAGIQFKDSREFYKMGDDGLMINTEGNVVNLSVGQVTGYRFGDVESGNKPAPDPLRNPPPVNVVVPSAPTGLVPGGVGRVTTTPPAPATSPAPATPPAATLSGLSTLTPKA